MVSTLLTPCDSCYTCDTPPPPQTCKCDAGATNQRRSMFVRINLPQYSGSDCCKDEYNPEQPPLGYKNEYMLVPQSSECGFVGGSILPGIGAIGKPSCFTDAIGNVWYYAGRLIYIFAKKPIEFGVKTDLVPADTISLCIINQFTSTDANFNTVRAEMRYWYDFGVCDCIPSQDIAATDLKLERVNWPSTTPTPCHTDNWTTINVIQNGNCGSTCGNGCCDDLESSGITGTNKFSISIGIDLDGCRPIAEVGLKTLTKTATCTYQWTQSHASGSCFIDAVGDDWQLIADHFVVSSVNTGQARPCTSAYLRMTYERIFDSATAYIQWTYDYDYCTYTTGTLALLSTEDTFPVDAPTFPSASVAAV